MIRGEEQKSILAYMYFRKYESRQVGIDYLSEGIPSYLQLEEKYGTIVKVETLPKMECRYYKIPGTGKIIVFCYHQERIPELGRDDVLIGFKYFMVTRYLDILNENDKMTVEDVCMDFIEECRGDPDRYIKAFYIIRIGFHIIYQPP